MVTRQLCKKTAILLALGGLAFSCWAEKVSSNLVVSAVNALIAQKGQLDCPIEGVVSSVRLCTATNGAAFYVAKLTGGGYVVMSTDTEIDPVIAISSESDLVEDPQNPLWALLVRDMATRQKFVAARNKAGAGLMSAAAPGKASVSSAASRWARLTASGASPATSGARLLSSGRTKISDVRVAPLLKTKWGQSKIPGGANCFNYYTPNNYVCGCTATAGAQILRYHKFPTKAVTPKTYKCKVDGKTVKKTQKGGVYAWNKMPEVPGRKTSLAQRQAIGKLTYDVGLAVGSNYRRNSTWGYLDKFVTLCRQWGYAHAKTFHYSAWHDEDEQEGFYEDELKSVLVPNLDAKLPVGVRIYNIYYEDESSHFVVADGYGYWDGLLSVHLNMGWDGDYDAWYVLPEFDAGYNWYTTINYLYGNIYPTGPSKGAIASGRVIYSQTDKPASGVVVTARDSSGKVQRATTDEKGIYAFILPEEEWEISIGKSTDPYQKTIKDSQNHCDLDFGLYQVKFDAKGGSCSKTAGLYGDYLPLGTLPKATRTGYTFEGWFTEPDGGYKVSSETLVESDATYYARWSPNRYKVAFDANGGSGYMAPMDFIYDEAQDLCPNDFRKDGVVFRGWSRAQRGLLSFADGATVTNLTSAPDAVLTLHAVWEGDVVATKKGSYFKATLSLLGYDVPTDGKTQYEVVAKGLPAGLELKSNSAVKDKNGKVIKKAKVDWWIEGVPTATLDYATTPAYLVITKNGKAEVLPLLLEVFSQDVRDLGELALGKSVNTNGWLAGVGSGWSVSGLPAGLSFATKKVTKKSGATTGTVAEAYSVYGKTTKAGLFTITAKKKRGAYYETKKFRVLVKPKSVDAAWFGDDLARMTNITTMAYVPLNWDLKRGGDAGDEGGESGATDLPAVSALQGNVATVTGLPPGLTFAASNVYSDKRKTKLKQRGQTIVGKPTKTGTYVVTFTKNARSGTQITAKTAQVLWKVVANDAELSLGFNDAGGVIANGTVGLKYGNHPLREFSATEAAKVTASGLPAGITLANLGGGQYAFAGFTTKAGTYLVTVTATLNGKTVRQRLALKVSGLPGWAKGTFNGYVVGADCRTNGLATASVTAAGAISGKFQELGTNWTFSASSYTGYDELASAYTVPVTAKYVHNNKTEKRKFTLTVEKDMLGGVATLMETGEGGTTVRTWQNLWGKQAYKDIGQRLFYTSTTKPYKSLRIKGTSDAGAAIGLTEKMTLSLKVTPNGAVTATMSFNTGKKRKNPKTQKVEDVIYEPICQTVVIPTVAADAEPFTGEAFLYFAPSAGNNFDGFVGSVMLP